MSETDFNKAAKTAHKRATTRQNLRKYDQAIREPSSETLSETCGRTLGFGLLEKAGGYDDLQYIHTLDQYKSSQKEAVGEQLLNNPSADDNKSSYQSVQEQLEELAALIRSISWIPSEDIQSFINVLISDFASRYHDIRNRINKTPMNGTRHRAVIANIFSHLKSILVQSLEACSKYYCKMSNRGVLSQAANRSRIISRFRIEMARGASTQDIVDKAIGLQNVVVLENVHQQDLLQNRIQSLKDAMPNVNFDILKSIVAFEKTRQDQTTVTSNQDQSKAARQPNKNYISDVMNDLNIMLFPKGSNNNDQGLYQLKEKILAVDLDNGPKEYIRYLLADKERRQHLLKHEDFQHALNNEDNYKDENDDYNGMNDAEAVDLKGKNIGEVYTSKFSDRSLKEHTASAFSGQSLEEKLSLTFDPSFLENMDEQVLKLKEVEEIYQELFQTELNDCGEVIEDKADLGIFAAIPPEFQTANNAITHLNKSMQAEEKLRAAVADTDDPNQADFDDYLLFLQEKAVDYLSEVLVPANLDQVNTSAFVDGAFDASLEENQREKFEKDYWNVGELTDDDFDTSSYLLTQQEAMKKAEELKKATSTDSSKDLNRSSSGSLSLESDLVGSDSQDEKSSVSTRSSMGYDPATGMPIFDDEDEQAAKLLDEAIEADKADYIEAQKTYQTQLEAIWDKFRMPFSQRLDMAVKYGKKQDNRPLLEKGIPLWEQTAKLIESREKMLIHAREFEEKCVSVPRSHRKTVEEVNAESSERQRIVQKLERVNKQLEKCIYSIRTSLKDEVTYKGENYWEKMKHDYSQMLFDVKKDKAIQ